MLTTLEKVGIVCMSVLGFQLFRAFFKIVYQSIIAPALSMNVDMKKMGQWAVVTGCTDGIGKAYAEALARKGLDVVLISRTLSKLEALASDIESTYKVRTKVIDIDFSEGPEIFTRIEKELASLEIGVLVNNVGISYPYPDYFLDLAGKDKVYQDIIRINVTALTNMTQIVLPQMVDRKRGVIINVSSTAALIPSPLLAVYSASKAYVEKFSEDLKHEYGKRGITVQCVMPGYVATKMSKIRRSTWMAPTPAKYVKSALQTVGIQDQTTGYYPHNLLVGTVRLLEGISPNLAVWFITRTMENIRRRALQKSQK